MKNYKFLYCILILTFPFLSFAQFNNSRLPESINNDGSAPDSSAILDVQSTTQGMLVPRMTSAQRSAISNAAVGLLVFDTDTGSFWFYNGTAWADLSSVNDSDWTAQPEGIYHNSGNVAINTSVIDGNSELYVFRPLGDYGSSKTGILSYRNGMSSQPDSGGINFSYLGIDSAIKGFSNWGNAYSAAVAGYGYLDYENSAAIIGGQQSGSIYGALGFRDSLQTWAGYFSGDVNVSGGIKIADGTEGAGKVLASDANGLASWQDESNIQLTEAEVDAYVGNNGYITSGTSSNMQPYLGLNYIIALTGFYPSPSLTSGIAAQENSFDPFIGEIILFAGNFAPQGWALCDGQLLSISSNTALFSILGTTYGGDGETTFGLPDLRGRTPIHKGSGPGLLPVFLGQKSGSNTVD